MSEHPQLQRIDDWIDMLEQKARTLLEGLEIDVEEMKPKERLDGAVKLMALAQRYIVLRQQREAGEPATHNSILLALRKQMRGELLESPSDE